LPEFEPGSGHVGFVVDKSALEHVIIHHHSGLVNRPVAASAIVDSIPLNPKKEGKKWLYRT
jgi:hypothetical protein